MGLSSSHAGGTGWATRNDGTAGSGCPCGAVELGQQGGPGEVESATRPGGTDQVGVVVIGSNGYHGSSDVALSLPPHWLTRRRAA